MLSQAITGIGAIASTGGGVDDLFENLCAGVTGHAPLRGFDRANFRARYAYEVDDRPAEGTDVPARTTALLLDAVGQAAKDAGLGEDLGGIPVLVGTGLRELRSLELWWRGDAELVWPQDSNASWEVAHLAYPVADRLGHGRPFIDAVYRARWEGGRDISDPAVVAASPPASASTPDPSRARPTTRPYAPKGSPPSNSSTASASSASPTSSTFIDGFDKYWGVDRLPAFVARVRARHLPPEPLTAATVDQGHAGGCG